MRPDTIAGMECLLALTYGYIEPSNGSSSSSDKSKQPKSSSKSKMQAGVSDHSSVGATGSATARSHASTSKGDNSLSARERTATGVAGALVDGSETHRPREGMKASPVASPIARPAAAAGGGGLGRLLDELRLYPTTDQMHLVDKKFGGESAEPRGREVCIHSVANGVIELSLHHASS